MFTTPCMKMAKTRLASMKMAFTDTPGLLEVVLSFLLEEDTIDYVSKSWYDSRTNLLLLKTSPGLKSIVTEALTDPEFDKHEASRALRKFHHLSYCSCYLYRRRPTAFDGNFWFDFYYNDSDGSTINAGSFVPTPYQVSNDERSIIWFHGATPTKLRSWPEARDDDFDELTVFMHTLERGKVARVFQADLKFEWGDRSVSPQSFPFKNFTPPSSKDERWLADRFDVEMYEDEVFDLTNHVGLTIDIWKENETFSILVQIHGYHGLPDFIRSRCIFF